MNGGLNKTQQKRIISLKNGLMEEMGAGFPSK